jgi:hypothetical protein
VRNMKRSNAGQKRTEAGVPLGERMTPNNGIDRSAQELRSWVPVALRAPAPGHAERWAANAKGVRSVRGCRRTMVI